MPKTQPIERSLNRLADLLREEREKQGLSMNRLAEKAGLSQSFISLIENNKRSLGMDAYLRVTTALRLDPADLLRRAVSQR